MYQSQVIIMFTLNCRLQKVFSLNLERSYLQRIGRMGQNLVWNSFSINPLCESNYIRIGRGHVDLVWNDLILTCNYCGIVDYHGKKQYNY